jgi:hypothetical protein
MQRRNSTLLLNLINSYTGTLFTPTRSIVILLVVIVLMLAGCGGPEGQSTILPTSQPVASATGDATDGSDGSSSANGLEPDMARIVERWVGEWGVPYRNVSGKVVSQDEAFATIDVTVELRETSESPWLTYYGTIELKRVSGVWQKNKAGELTSPEAQATQTAVGTAQAIETAEAEAKVYTETALSGRMPVEDIHLLSPDTGWAVGGSDMSYGIVWRLEAGKWVPEHYGGARYPQAVGMASEDDGWLITDAPYRYRDGSWVVTEALSNAVGSALEIEMLSPTEGWAVTEKYILLHFTGGRWQSVPLSVEGKYPKDIAFSSPTEGWIVGKDLLLKWDGAEWTEEEVAESFVRIEALPSGEAWALGESSVWRYTEDKGWEGVAGFEELLPSLSATTFTDLDVLSSGDVWVSGYNDRYNAGETFVLRYENGGWKKIFTLPDANAYVFSRILTLDIASPTEGWAGGSSSKNRANSGFMLQYKNGEWTVYDGATNP